MGVPSKSDEYMKLIEHLRYAQEAAAMLKHLNAAEGDGPGLVIAQGWMHVSEALKKMVHSVTLLATKGILQ